MNDDAFKHEPRENESDEDFTDRRIMELCKELELIEENKND